MIHLQDKCAIVTGGASGFGAGICRAFVAAGARVGVLDQNFSAAEQLAAELGEAAQPLAADVTDKSQLKDALATMLDWAGDLNIWVNNAGRPLPPTPLEEVSDEDFDALHAVNVRGVFLASQVVVPYFKSRGGVILNIASTAGVSPRPGLTWYNASKGWLITATRSMAVELAPHNIRVNALNPVAGDTPMLATFLGTDTDEARARFVDTIPLGRLSQPEDLGAAALYLCSDAASMITGVAMEVDGGRCI